MVVITPQGTRTLTTADLDASNTRGRAFHVLSSGTDVKAPMVSSVVPQYRTDGKYWFSFGLWDHISGVRESRATVRNRDTGEMLTCQARASAGELARASDHYCPLVVPAGTRLSLVSITAVDGAGNSATYTPAQIDVIRGVREYTFLTYDFTAQ